MATGPAALLAQFTTGHDTAEQFRLLAPWEWMDDTQIFGVRDPRTGEVGWCAVMGAGGTTYGLAVYRGERGYGWLRVKREAVAAMLGPTARLLGVPLEKKTKLRSLDGLRRSLERSLTGWRS